MAISTIDNSGISASAAISTTKLGTGAVLQVVVTNYAGNANISSSVVTPTDMGTLTLNITPSSASNKILVSWNVAGISSLANNTTPAGVIIFIADASNNVICRVCDQYVAGGAAGAVWSYMAGSYLHSPASTSAQTYKIRWYTTSGVGMQINNYVTNSGTMSSISAMEIAG
jgi:hypothetical protein